MKRTITLLSTILFLAANAQVFNGPTGPIINTGGQETVFAVNVSGLPANVDSIFGLVEVCVTISHPKVEELSVNIVSPSGIKVQLSGVSSLSGSDFSGTCFNNSAPKSITTSSAPYSGSLRPVGNLGRINCGKPANGVWKLIVKDFEAGSVSGSLVSWSIKFGNSPPKPVVLRSSNLPIVIINTGGQVLSEADILVDLGIIDNGANRNNVTDYRNNYNGKATCHVRGSSSKKFEKESLKLELKDASGVADVEAPLLGMPTESDWVLTAGYNDKTLMRNPLSQYIYQRMGHYSPRTRFVEVVINDQYAGIYLLMEQPKRGKERVPVSKMTPMDNAYPYVTGGYIVQINRSDDPGWYSKFPGVSGTGAKFYYQYNYPKEDEITPPQKDYIKAVLDSFETAMASPTFADKNTGYPKFINMDSFIDFLIINEFSKNADAYKLSTYIFKDNIIDGGKLSVGPVWDYDIAWHNCNFGNAFNEQGWQFEIPNNEYPIPTWWKTFFQDKSFKDRLYCRYHTFRKYLLSNNEIYAYIDANAQLLNEAQQRNFRQFPIMGAYIYPNPQDQSNASYANEVQDLKNWVAKRSAWMDSNVPGFCTDVSAGELSELNNSVSVFPNPFSSALNVILDTGKADGIIQLTLLDITGAAVYQSAIVSRGGAQNIDINTERLPAGVYLLKISGNGIAKYQKVIKYSE